MESGAHSTDRGREAVAAFARAHLAQLDELTDSGAMELHQQVSDWMREQEVVFAGEVIPFVLGPHVIDVPTMRHVRHSVEVLTRVLDRFCFAYRTDPALRAALDLPPAEADLIDIEPTLDNPLQVCRLDALLLPDRSIQFLEFNAESPAGIGYTDRMFDGLHEHFRSMNDPVELRLEYEQLVPHLVRTVANVEQRWRIWAAGAGVPGVSERKGASRRDRPRALLVDAGDIPAAPELDMLCEALDNGGFDAGWTHLDKLVWHDGRLRVEGQPRPVDVVYRRALVDDLLSPDAGPGAAALLAAVRSGAVAMLNPFPARVANNKKLLALLAAPEFDYLLHDDDERDVLAKTLPWTRILMPGDAVLPGGATDDMAQFAISERDHLVLKPASDYGGRNVHLGVETDPDQWAALVTGHIGTGEWILQELIDVPRAIWPVVEDGRVVTRERYFNINPFAIGGRYAGMITRISTNPVINVSAGGGLLPCVTIEPAPASVAAAKGTAPDANRSA